LESVFEDYICASGALLKRDKWTALFASANSQPELENLKRNWRESNLAVDRALTLDRWRAASLTLDTVVLRKVVLSWIYPRIDTAICPMVCPFSIHRASGRIVLPIRPTDTFTELSVKPAAICASSRMNVDDDDDDDDRLSPFIRYFSDVVSEEH
jgi:hypothetical protein